MIRNITLGILIVFIVVILMLGQGFMLDDAVLLVLSLVNIRKKKRLEK